MTGLSGSGKSTIAKALERHLVVEQGLSVQNLDGDNGARFSCYYMYCHASRFIAPALALVCFIVHAFFLHNQLSVFVNAFAFVQLTFLPCLI